MANAKTSKVWIGVGAFVLAGGVATTTQAVPLVETHQPDLRTGKTRLLDGAAALPGRLILAQGKGAGGGSAEGGEGGEGKIDPAAVEADPIDYGIALQVIAAHYHAGLLAYENKQQEAGAQMFAHGLTEVYVELEDIFKKHGVTGLGDKMNAAVEAGTAKKPVQEVRQKVKAVLDALVAAESGAPKSDKPPQAIKTEVAAEMLERAAEQYRVSADSKDFETYLDGLGFSLAAHEQARAIMPWLKKQAPKKAAALEKVLALASQAYPGIKRPAKKIDTGRFLAAASEARLAVSRLP